MTHEYTSDEADQADEADEADEASDLAIVPPRRAVRWLMGLLAVVVALSMTVLLFPRESPRVPPTPIELTAGVVSSIAADGSTFCMDVEVTGKRLCSDLLQSFGSAPLRVGEHVEGRFIQVGSGTSAEHPVFLVIAPPAPLSTSG